MRYVWQTHRQPIPLLLAEMRRRSLPDFMGSHEGRPDRISNRITMNIYRCRTCNCFVRYGWDYCDEHYTEDHIGDYDPLGDLYRQEQITALNNSR